MTTEKRPADVAALTEAEREALIEAIQNGTQDEWVETILAIRTAAARAEGYEAGRAEVTAAVEALADEWAKATCTCGGISAYLPCQYADRITGGATARDAAEVAARERVAWSLGQLTGLDDAERNDGTLTPNPYPYPYPYPYRAEAYEQAVAGVPRPTEDPS